MNIFLRPIYLYDINRIYEIKSNPLNYNKEFTSFDTLNVTQENIKKWFYNIINEIDTIRFGIVLHDNNYLIGLITLGKINYIESKCELHIAIDHNYQGIGIGQESLLLLIDYIKNIIKLKKIFLDVHKNHNIAINLYKKIGFKEIDIVDYKEINLKENNKNNFIYMIYIT